MNKLNLKKCITINVIFLYLEAITNHLTVQMCYYEKA